MIKLSRSVSDIVGATLMVVGLGITLIASGLYAYSQYERSLAESRPKSPTPTPSVVLASTLLDSTENSDSTDLVKQREVADETPGTSTPFALPTPTPPKPASPAIRVVIPQIGVDTPIVESKIVNGEWQVPKFVAGHLQGTANPGENGNVVLAGHLESLSSGNVFARLGELRLGDSVTLFTEHDEFHYQVTETKVVQNDDMSVVAPTAQPTLTMITCTGTFNILTRDYSHRLIVISKPLKEPTEK